MVLYFATFDGCPLTSFQFNAVLKKALVFIGQSYDVIKSHSFRIGRASSMFNDGLSVDVIKAKGRWRSNAYKSYIR
jgi:hypothetical protein